jgi:hypothetical protein
MSREVHFIIPKDCKGLAIDHRGFVGPACFQQLEAFKRAMAAMGIEFAEEQITPKAEAYAVEEISEVTESERVSE